MPKRTNNPFWKPFETSRDFTYVEDTVTAMVNALETGSIEDEIMNIRYGQTHKMKDILALIKRETGAEEKQVVLDKSRFRSKRRRNAHRRQHQGKQNP